MTGNIRPAGRTGFLFVLAFILASGLFFTGSVSGQTRSRSDAVRLILDGLDHPNYSVRRAALRQVPFLPLNRDSLFNRVALLFDGFREPVTAPGFEFLKRDALKTLYSLDPDRTVDLLAEKSEAVLRLFSPGELFGIIGYRHVPRFDNLFLALMYHGEMHSAAEVRVYAAWYLATGEKKYLNYLLFLVPETLEPFEYIGLYRYLYAEKLPVKRIYYSLLKNSALPVYAPNPGVSANPGRSYTLEELLSQAALYRLGLTGRVSTDDEDDGDGLSRKYPYSPWLQLCRSAAYFFAGVPGEEHLLIVVENWNCIEKILQYRLAESIAHSPSNEVQENFLYFLLQMPDPELQRIGIEGLAREVREQIPPELLQLLSVTGDPWIQSTILEMIGSTGNTRWNSILYRFMESDNPAVAVTAAGQIVRNGGGVK